LVCGVRIFIKGQEPIADGGGMTLQFGTEEIHDGMIIGAVSILIHHWTLRLRL
jgi:hypothetical protein